jgi:hypothetical protein
VRLFRLRNASHRAAGERPATRPRLDPADSTVFVCRKCKGHQCVTDFLERRIGVQVEEVRCQKVCEGSLVGLDVDGRLEWFEQVGEPRALAGIAGIVRRRAHPNRVLRRRRVRKLAGRPPR